MLDLVLATAAVVTALATATGTAFMLFRFSRRNDPSITVAGQPDPTGAIPLWWCIANPGPAALAGVVVTLVEPAGGALLKDGTPTQEVRHGCIHVGRSREHNITLAPPPGWRGRRYRLRFLVHVASPRPRVRRIDVTTSIDGPPGAAVTAPLDP